MLGQPLHWKLDARSDVETPLEKSSGPTSDQHGFPETLLVRTSYYGSLVPNLD